MLPVTPGARAQVSDNPAADSAQVFVAHVGLLAAHAERSVVLAEASEPWTAFEDTSDTASVAARTFKPGRFYGGVGGILAADALVMAGLSSLWYDGDHVPFHWYKPAPSFDDGWLDDWHTNVQQDKLGHLFVSWQLARVFGAYGRWAGLTNRQAGLFGGVVSAAFQTQIEIFDGFDEAYGASRTDIAANVVGGVVGGLKVAYPEKLAWFDAKYSYHISPYYDEGVSDNAVLGYLGNAIKDYDGITYWFVIHPSELVSEEDRWPEWVSLAVGYSGTNLAHAISGMSDPRNKGLPNVHERQLFLSLDFGLIERLPLPKVLRPVQTFFSFIHLPAPALSIGAGGNRWYWLYY